MRPARAPSSRFADRVFDVEDEPLERLDVLRVEVLLRAHDQAVLGPVAQPHPQAQPLAGRPVLVLDDDEGAAVIRLVHDALGLEFLLLEHVDDELQALAQVLLAERARHERHREAVDIDQVDDVLGKLRERTLEVAGGPAFQGFMDCGTIVGERHGEKEFVGLRMSRH